MKTVNGYAFKSTDFSDGGKVPILKIKSVKPPNVQVDEVQFYNEEITEQLKRVIIRNGDILITMTGSGVNQMSSAVGQVGKYLFNFISLLNQRICKLSPTSWFFKEYAYQIISSKEIHMELLFGSTGSANQANISPDQINELIVLKPSAKILEKYEKSISIINNCKRINGLNKLFDFEEIVLSKMAKG